jgi:hypothetical protein
VTWTGDLSGMGQLEANLRRLASVPSRASKRIAEGLEELVEDEFATGRDPYGTPWRPITDATLAKRSQTTEPPLTDLGQMHESLAVRPLPGAGVSITIDHPAAPHQTGWHGTQGSGPARPILPSRRLPVAWREVLESAVRETVRQ